MSRVGRSPRGVVLGTVVLLLLAVTLVVHAALVLARAYREGGEEMWDAVRARRAAGGRADLAVLAGDSTSEGWVVLADGVEARLESRRLSREVALLAGSGRAAVAHWWAGRMVWRADPLTRGAAISAAVRLDGRLRTPVGSAPLVTATAGGSCPADGAPLTSAPLGPEGVRVGPLDAAGLAARLAPWTGGATPATCPPGGCPPSMRVASASLTISRGAYSGLLLVAGDLTLTDSAQYRGLVLVEGSLTVANSARIEGAVQALGDVVVGPSGSIHGDPCLVSRLWADGLAEGLGRVALDRRPWALWGPPR